MPVVQKIKSLVHRNSEKSIPQAPPAPLAAAPLAPATVAQPLNAETLLVQKDSLAHTTAPLNNANIYNNLAEESLLRQNSLEGQSLMAETTYIQSTQRASLGLVRAEPTVIQTIEKDVVIQERIHPVEKEEIQPIIYREREQLDVKQVTQMMHETAVEPTIIQQRELAPEYREAIVERGAPIEQNIVLPSTQVDAIQRTQVVHAPIVEEVVKKTIIEEIQPVLERDVFQPVLIQNTQAIHEKIIEAPTVYREVREVRELGTRGSVGMDSALVQEALLQRDYQNDALYTHRGLSSSSYEEQRLSQQMMLERQNLSQGSYELNQSRLSQSNMSLNNSNMLATGQVLPTVQSSRPAYAYLPANYTEQRPAFIGTASEYVRAASGMNQSTFAHAKNLPTVYPMQNMNSQQAPIALRRQ